MQSFSYSGKGKFCGKSEDFALRRSHPKLSGDCQSAAPKRAFQVSLTLLVVCLVQLDAQRLEKLQILIADLEFGIGIERACRDQ
jgi:hypothetical protein